MVECLVELSERLLNSRRLMVLQSGVGLAVVGKATGVDRL